MDLSHPHRARTLAVFVSFFSVAGLACSESSPPVEGNSADITQAKKGAHKVTRCFGTEPFWRLEIDEKTVTWRSADEGAPPRTIENKGPKPAIGGAPAFVSLYQGRTTEDPNRFLNVVISDGVCSDGMSEEMHPYSVSVLSGTELHVGCCE